MVEHLVRMLCGRPAIAVIQIHPVVLRTPPAQRPLPEPQVP